MSDAQTGKPRAVVLGGYGLIGAACLRGLLDTGFDVTGVGRDAIAAARTDARADWIIRDLTAQTASDWTRDLAGADIVVNAAGALQDGARDSLQAIHEDMITALVQGLEGRDIRFVQISAAGVSLDASTAFFRTKARGDAILMASALNWTVLRPTLVLARAAYGGTALLRAAAALPLIGFDVFSDRSVQTVAVDDVAKAVVQAARGQIAPQTCADLTAPDVQTKGALLGTMRTWLGFAPWRATVSVPGPVLRAVGKVADALGWLGWRSPLRTTALTVLQDGIAGDPAAWGAAGGSPCKSTDATLRAMPATVQDRWHARLFLLLPLAIAILSLFWLVSGLIGLARAPAAIDVLRTRDIAQGTAYIAVIGGALADIALGAAILWRRWARRAALGMIVLSFGYLGMGTLFTPDLWIDPLGPFVKVIPSIGLAAVVAALMDDR